MGNKQPKAVSTELTDKRSCFENVQLEHKLWFILILEVALLKVNTKYTEKGIHIHNPFISK